jgi:integrase
LTTNKARPVRPPAGAFAPVLPTSTRTLGGYQFDPRDEIWAWRDAVTRASLNFASVKRLLCPAMLHSFKLVMLWLAENRATAGVNTTFDHLRTFFRFVRASRRSPIMRIAGADILNYRAAHVHDGTLTAVRPILRKWHLMGLTGVSEAVAQLESIRIKDSVKGRAVRTHDPKMGPFTSIEFDGLISNLHQSVAGGSMDASYAAFAYLLIGLGIRPAQCALLKVSDITCESHDERRRYILRVPQVKQGHRKARAEFRERVLPESLGKILHEQAKRMREDFIGVLEDPCSAPLIPARGPSTAVAPGYEHHAVAHDLTVGLVAALGKLEVYSERTGKRLHTRPIRFRRTFATRAAAAGWSPPAIAEALGHSNTKNVMVYVEAIPDIAARIDRAMATEMAPLAQAFAGTLIKDEGEAVRGGDPASRILDARIDRSGKPLGSCGQYAFCGFSAPLACYTCQHFEPWLDGPHASVRDYLLKRRAHLLETASEQIAQINDRRILAVEQVIQLCAQAKLAP